jgi:hypothetical protein
VLLRGFGGVCGGAVQPRDYRVLCAATSPLASQQRLGLATADLAVVNPDWMPARENRRMTVARSIGLFIAAGVAEIGGGYLIWRWLRDGAPIIVGVAGAIILVVYGIIPTFQRSHDSAAFMPPTAAYSWSPHCCGAGAWTGPGRIGSTSSAPQS